MRSHLASGSSRAQPALGERTAVFLSLFGLLTILQRRGRSVPTVLRPRRDACPRGKRERQATPHPQTDVLAPVRERPR